MILSRSTPLNWRKDWKLFRCVQETDSHGDLKNVYHMDAPDFTGAAGSASGVAWHVDSREATLKEYGEGVTASAVFLLDSDVALSVFDRCIFGGSVWEIRGILPRTHFRTVKLVEVGQIGH